SMHPHFLGIGAQRAGTTWLHANLSSHPEIWMPRIKEIHYFDRKYPVSISSWTLHTRDNREMLQRRMKRLNVKKLLDRIKSPRFSELLWDYKYYRGNLTDEWYCSLFAEAGARVSGDITPEYAILEASSVQKIKSLLPDAKIIFLMRNPIERAWSHARKDFTRFQSVNPDEISRSDYISHFNSPGSLLRGDYLRTIDIWSRHYGEGQFLVRFYDEIESDPVNLLTDVCRFLQVGPPTAQMKEIAERKINAAKEFEIPAEYRSVLFEIYGKQIALLSEKYCSYARRWLDEIR
ncbi:MAG TPA: sulfotransferase, partial [Pseudomonadales bacterium]|nr:sulfotransferase [Pseudomonadales bacterium]